MIRITETVFERLRSVLRYDHETGLFYWRIDVNSRAMAGRVAGSLTSWGYTLIQVDRQGYKAHRLAWLFFTGGLPSGLIDHVNGDKRDNRISNLRMVDHRINCENKTVAQSNSSTGILGVSARNGRFYARIGVHRKKHFLGAFDTKEEAESAYIAAKRRLHDGCTL